MIEREREKERERNTKRDRTRKDSDKNSNIVCNGEKEKGKEKESKLPACQMYAISIKKDAVNVSRLFDFPSQYITNNCRYSDSRTKSLFLAINNPQTQCVEFKIIKYDSNASINTKNTFKRGIHYTQ